MRGVTVFKISLRVLVGRIKFAVFDGLQSDYRGHAEDILGGGSPWQVGGWAGESHEDLPVGVAVSERRVSLTAMLPLLRSGKMRTLALPPT
jgi:hypothetical protein